MEWKKISQRHKYEGWRPIDGVTFQLPTGITVEYDIVQAKDSVCVMAITPDKRVILAKQFRPGPQQYVIEMPGGCIDSDEEPIEAARRELLEETGYAGNLQLAGTGLRDAYTTQVCSAFVATDCVKVQEPENHPREPIEIVSMTLPEFRQHVRSGQLTDNAAGYQALDFLGLL